ncbi:DUF6455 family protein [Sulfitobacter sp. HNIBRBA3233]|uniref:DUF6455 family protein n=1 Tax=Sulfitobacter marinivivus TaxID=3158558 RepID=UPI0032DFF061
MTIREALGSFYAVREARLGQMGGMLDITGAMTALERGLCGDSELQSAVIRCLNCRNDEACKAWLAKAEHGAPPPSFCPNAQLFDGLRPR